MADQKISQLTAATTPLAGTEVLPIVQGGATKKVTTLDVTGGVPVGKGNGNQVSNVAVGSGAGSANGSGILNTFVGEKAGNVSTGSENTMVGWYAAYKTINGANTAIGSQALANNTTGYSNTAIGQSAGSNLTSGSNNGFFGINAQPSAAAVSDEYTYGNSSVTKHRFPGGNLVVVTAGKGILLPGGITWTSGAGSPEGVVTAPVGSLYSRSDGGLLTSLYVKESGSGNTGWVGK